MSTGILHEPQSHPEDGGQNVGASVAKLICPKCMVANKAGVPVCEQCGTIFTTGNATTLIDKNELDLQAKRKSTGSLLAKQTKPVFLDIGDQKIELPNQLVIVLGRSTNDSTTVQPDIALNDFGAAEKGVSRCHARLTRYYNLLYITDMGSRNGTFLNGQPLVNNNARILHTGDELLLGSLKLRIRF